jgi:indole-3-glycerol phosphate synthase
MRMSSNFLETIFEFKRNQVKRDKQNRPLDVLLAEIEQHAPALDIVAAIRARSRPSAPAFIAEVKCASPSKGALLAEQDPLRLAQIYQAGGAAAISVLTEERYFHGRLDFLAQIASMQLRLPLLRKDFIFDPYQIYEARAAGADALLLIVAGLDPSLLSDLHDLSLNLGMTPLIEVHSLEEIQIALGCSPRLLGINNRDLHSFSVNLETTRRLCPAIPGDVCLVSESGIQTDRDLVYLAEIGVDAVLVGEALVTAVDIPARLRELTQGAKR